MFLPKNKTAPLHAEESVIETGNVSKNVKSTTIIVKPQKSLQTLPLIVRPVKPNANADTIKIESNRPHTAPGRSQHFVNKITVISIPRQITQE